MVQLRRSAQMSKPTATMTGCLSLTPTPPGPNTFDDLVTWISPNILYNRLIAAGRLPRPPACAVIDRRQDGCQTGHANLISQTGPSFRESAVLHLILA
jgi:hypothetical protein